MAREREINSTQINKNMLISIVTLATKEIAGVVAIAEQPFYALKKMFFKNIGHGVGIKWTNLGLVIDVYVVVEIGYEVADIVYRVQQNIKNSMSSMVDLPIKAINVHIMDAEKNTTHSKTNSAN